MSKKNGNNKSGNLDIGTLSGHLWQAANILRGPVHEDHPVGPFSKSRQKLGSIIVKPS